MSERTGLDSGQPGPFVEHRPASPPAPATPRPPAPRPAAETAPLGDEQAGKGGGPRPDPTRPDPTRYGDWEVNGRCIDF